MPKITHFLWYDDQAEKAMNFYTSRPGLHGPERRTGAAVHTSHLPFRGLRHARRSGRTCGRRLCEGGNNGLCGWPTDKFGLSWQIIPKGLGGMLYDPDPARSKRVLKVMLEMSKIDLGGLKRAYGGE